MLKYSSVKQLSEKNGENEFSRAKKCEIITGYKNFAGRYRFTSEITTVIIETRKIPHERCCPEYLIEVSCILCGIITRTISSNNDRRITRQIRESFEKLHKHNSVLVLSNGEDYQELMADMGKKYENMSLQCNFCGKKIHEVNYLISLAKTVMLRELCESYSQHLSEDECVKNIDSHKASIDEIIDAVNKSIADNGPHKYADYFLPKYDKELMNIIVKQRKCECGRQYITECNICGVARKDNRMLVSGYERCAKKHFSKHPQMNIRDVITAINPRLMETCTCETEEDMKKSYRHRHYGKCKFFMKCDGYMCAICGVEYTDASKKLPPRAIVLGHLKKCIEENKESIRRYGNYCI